jgi:hypothetical protein
MCGAVGWLVAYPAYQRHRAIQEIARVYGQIGRVTVGPKWLLKLGIGLDRVERVELDGPEITDDVLQDISSLTSLRELYLSDTERGIVKCCVLEELKKSGVSC